MASPRKRMLVVESAEVMRAVLRNLFWFYGYDADCAGSMVEAAGLMDVMEGGGYSIAIIEHSPPELNGLEITRRIKSQWESLPVLGTSLDSHRVDFIRAGADAFLKKPFDFGELTETVLKVSRSRPAGGRSRDIGPP